ncbi:MAG: hypothetical protein JWM06_2768 [Actinomycetia bacterium]|jgi:hypothetical protein|nr:hypothetical protein [Actinomycetes bacterium]
MSAEAPALTLSRSTLDRLRRTIASGGGAVERLPVPAVLGALIAIEWTCVLALARTVRHAGWLYYQGGDQLWNYTLGWLLGHGELGQTAVGYGLPTALAPVARIAGPNLLSALPAIILFNVVVLLPVAMLALYGIAARIGGRLFGYWTLVLWIAVPFVGIAYTNVGYHQKYTELLLPQAFGLTALADFPTMVAVVGSLYFCGKVIFTERPLVLDGIAAGVIAGVAIAIKPSAALFLIGPLLAFAYARRGPALVGFLSGIAPALIALAVWKERGLGHLPLVSGIGPHPAGSGLASVAPLLALDLGHRLNQLNWSHLGNNINALREHFWSGRVLVWLFVAGLVGLARRSWATLLLIGGPLVAFAIVKGSYASASVEDGSVFRIMMPAFPAFILGLASVPLLLPHAPRLLKPWRPAFAEPPAHLRRWLVIAGAVLSAVIPLAAFAAAQTTGGAAEAASLSGGTMPVPANVDLQLRARQSGQGVQLSWRGARSVGGPAFYRVWRAPAKGGNGFTCDAQVPGGRQCYVSLPEITAVHNASYVDRPGKGQWVYRIVLAANWLNDPAFGDAYLVGAPVEITVR